jgi:ribosome biogenesis protein Nip4
MTKIIDDFGKRFEAEIELMKNLVVRKKERFFLLTRNLKRLAVKDFFYAGTYLGKNKHGVLYPSFGLLRIISQRNANKITVNERTEWLFICGRDVFSEGITKVTGSCRQGEYVLVMNQYDECLGFGRMVDNLHRKQSGVAVKNVLDVGDFLKREQAQY